MVTTFLYTLMAIGLLCFILFVVEHIQGRMSINTLWTDMTPRQWTMSLGTLLLPSGFFGSLLQRIFS